MGYPYTRTFSRSLGRPVEIGKAGRPSKKDSSSSLSTARSTPVANDSTTAVYFSLDLCPWTVTRTAWATTWALVRIRLPARITPEPPASTASERSQGRHRSTCAVATSIFTTDGRTSFSATGGSSARVAGASGKTGSGGRARLSRRESWAMAPDGSMASSPRGRRPHHHGDGAGDAMRRARDEKGGVRAPGPRISARTGERREGVASCPRRRKDQYALKVQ